MSDGQGDAYKSSKIHHGPVCHMFHQLSVHDSYQSLKLCIFVYHQPKYFVQPNPKLQQN